MTATVDTQAIEDHAILCMPNVPIAMTLALTTLSDRDLLYHLINRVHVLTVSHDQILELTTDLIEQVNPMIEQVSNGPIGKMLGIKS